MARKPARNINAEGQARRRSRPTIVLWASISVVSLLIFAMATVMLIFFGMLPSFVAFIIDRTDEKYVTFCVTAMNFCGVFPYLIDLWTDQHTILASIETLTNVFALVVMYGSAGFGWIVFTTVPPVISSILSAINQRRVITLRNSQRTLISEWGEGVAHKNKSDEFDVEASAAGPSVA